MGEIRKTYDVSFKNKTVDLYLKKGIGYKTVAREMEIDPSLVRRWVRGACRSKVYPFLQP
ncbi:MULTISPECIES: transposase [unclassified Paenibacillus]|uniref:transposase n=1 Tax=unclassified Paenibacillus TaxID=185978 RepID=UPI001F3028EA|nr:transposase [Paenibacillus sp. MZ03-122A]MCF2720207.1 transposase [Paenibacillus sp. UKAQ_18]MCP3778509.1 transposase [Paenibacillus sp. MZ03-122A]